MEGHTRRVNWKYSYMQKEKETSCENVCCYHKCIWNLLASISCLLSLLLPQTRNYDVSSCQRHISGILLVGNGKLCCQSNSKWIWHLKTTFQKFSVCRFTMGWVTGKTKEIWINNLTSHFSYSLFCTCWNHIIVDFVLFETDLPII